MSWELEGLGVVHSHAAGIEGTVSREARAIGLREARYGGGDEAHLQHPARAAAINFGRLANWLSRMSPARTRASRFAALVA